MWYCHGVCVCKAPCRACIIVCRSTLEVFMGFEHQLCWPPGSMLLQHCCVCLERPDPSPAPSASTDRELSWLLQNLHKAIDATSKGALLPSGCYGGTKKAPDMSMQSELKKDRASLHHH